MAGLGSEAGGGELEFSTAGQGGEENSQCILDVFAPASNTVCGQEGKSRVLPFIPHGGHKEPENQIPACVLHYRQEQRAPMNEYYTNEEGLT